MDGTQSTPVPERRPSTPEIGAEQALSDKLEAKVAPAAAEAAQNRPKADDGMATAQAQVASITVSDDDQAQATATATANPSVADAPLTAADVDVIEPEWVKKAEEAVAANRDDPRAEEDAVEAVQIEYLKQRYNLDVKASDDKP